MLFAPACLTVYYAFDGPSASWLVLLWLALICALLVRVAFEVGEGCTRPVVLVVAPVLLLLRAGAVPLAVVAGHVLAQLPDVARDRLPPRRVLMGVADSWFSLAPAVVVGAVGVPASWRAGLIVALAAVAAQF